MHAHAKTLLVAALLTGCQTVHHSVLPQDPITISVEQRGRAAIPGSTQSLFVCLGDITRGQMMLSLENKKGDTIVDACSVRYGDIVAFELGELRHYLQVVKVHNHLFDTDLAEIRISSAEPGPLPPQGEEKEGEQKKGDKN